MLGDLGACIPHSLGKGWVEKVPLEVGDSWEETQLCAVSRQNSQQLEKWVAQSWRGILFCDIEATINEKWACFITYKYAWFLQILYCLVYCKRYISRVAIHYGFFLLHFELFLSNHWVLKAGDMLNGIFSTQFLRIYTFILSLFSLILTCKQFLILPLRIETGFFTFLYFSLEYEPWLSRLVDISQFVSTQRALSQLG